jgi:hypothetical protein
MVEVDPVDRPVAVPVEPAQQLGPAPEPGRVGVVVADGGRVDLGHGVDGQNPGRGPVPRPRPCPRPPPAPEGHRDRPVGQPAYGRCSNSVTALPAYAGSFSSWEA